ncbi:aspartyl-tRNA(Asn)/glutamyl-tRNA(Gln) amidotransferase subunit A [Pseudonocardia sediminis]|uniref:Aspartyl-tRNA(Asn)/glutamyl-tRNA(Gln) amidotransferase subunit A n=1 Tax=Pseudonocardia sediminis TaxID=1397368 RepID=A0A4V2FQB6_PSEST|nr:amidase [Pseudonocardia sediminis]RZT84080.1 aspartyl-tRNA(Asn)/glutamyl-tRNA(Gln) amidotransferase subunit A [Pseudonocardia sediminis]
MSDPTTADLSATELLAGYRSGEISPVQATRDALDRIEAHDGAVNAFCLVDADSALAQAKDSEARWQAGEPVGPLDGVPTSIKDVFLTIGWPTRRGSTTTSAEGPWEVDGPPVARVREAGAVLIGKNTTPELAWKGVTDSPLTGVTTNPWNPALTAGGSSGGSAAAVGLGMGQLSIGTDAGGSVRIPAAFTGTVAHKPTYGRIAHYPGSPFGTLAHPGPMTRTVADTALLHDVISRPDPRDPWVLDVPRESAYERLAGGAQGLRIAFSPTLGFATVDPEVAGLVAAAVEVFTSLGATVEIADPGFADPVEPFELLWNASAAKSLEPIGAEGRARMDPALVAVAERGDKVGAVDYLSAMAVRNELGTLMGQFHTEYDLLLTPALPITAFPGGLEVPEGSANPRWWSWTPFTYPFNMTQQPATSVPCGFTAAGLPVGLQVVGPRHADATVIAAAYAYEQATEHHLRRPALLG